MKWLLSTCADLLEKLAQSVRSFQCGISGNHLTDFLESDKRDTNFWSCRCGKHGSTEQGNVLKRVSFTRWV